MKLFISFIAMLTCLWIVYHQRTYSSSDPRTYTLEMYVRDNNVQKVEAMLNSGMSPNGNPSEPSNSPLRAALSSGASDVALLLIDRGAKLNENANFPAESILLLACKCDVRVMQKLIDKGIKVDKVVYSATVVHELCQLHNDKYNPNFDDDLTAKIELVIKHGADPNKKNSDGNTPMHLAAMYGNSTAIQALAKHHVDFNVQNKEGDTPLMIAAEKRQLNAMRLLAKLGARKDLRNKQGQTALDIVGDIKSLLTVGGKS